MLETNRRGDCGEERNMVRVPEINLETIYDKDSKDWSPSRSRKLSTALKFTKSSGEKKKIKTEKYF